MDRRLSEIGDTEDVESNPAVSRTFTHRPSLGLSEASGLGMLDLANVQEIDDEDDPKGGHAQTNAKNKLMRYSRLQVGSDTHARTGPV